MYENDEDYFYSDRADPAKRWQRMRAWVASVEATHYCLGSAMGPHPFPWLVREFQRLMPNAVLGNGYGMMDVVFNFAATSSGEPISG